MAIKKEIAGEMVEFRVTDGGRFVADLGDHGEVGASTLVEAMEAAKVVITNAKKAATKPIDVTVLGIMKRTEKAFYGNGSFQSGDHAIDFVLRGFTERTRTLLVTTTGSLKGGDKEKLDVQPFGERVVRRLSAAEHAEYARLQDARIAAEREIEQFRAGRLVNWREHFGVGK